VGSDVLGQRQAPDVTRRVVVRGPRPKNHHQHEPTISPEPSAAKRWRTTALGEAIPGPFVWAGRAGVATSASLVDARSRNAIILQAMTNLLVRDLPDDVHRALQRRARSRGQSLQQYLSSELARIAERPSLAEVLDRIDRRSGGEVGLARAAEDLAEERERS
jgi:plasmid stability protein